MKLHWSPRSPFVRKVMVTAHELGVADRMELVRARVAMTAPNEVLMADNPLSKIPTLVLDDGSAVYDSRVICEYLNGLAGGALFPSNLDARRVTLRRQALGDGLLDVLVLWRNESMRPETQRSSAFLDAYRKKYDATMLAFEREAPQLATRALQIGEIAIGCALCYLDFRFPELPWRTGHEAIAAWHVQFADRPSVKATEPRDD